jgi:hypothetical protein
MTTNHQPSTPHARPREMPPSTPPVPSDLTEEEARQIAREEADYSAPTPETFSIHFQDRNELHAFCREGLRSSPKDLSGLTPAARALVAAFREMPILADILMEGIQTRYADYDRERVVRGRADMDLLYAIHGHREAHGLTLQWANTPEAIALFEHPDFDQVRDARSDSSEIRRFQALWRTERLANRDALRGIPPPGPVTGPAITDAGSSTPPVAHSELR